MFKMGKTVKENITQSRFLQTFYFTKICEKSPVLYITIKCNTKPFPEPQFEVNQEKGVSLHIAIYITVWWLRYKTKYIPLYKLHLQLQCSVHFKDDTVHLEKTSQCTMPWASQCNGFHSLYIWCIIRCNAARMRSTLQWCSTILYATFKILQRNREIPIINETLKSMWRSQSFVYLICWPI